MSIEIHNLKHVYHPGTPLETIALQGIDLSIQKKQWLTIVGHTGSGKSTLAQHLNALLFCQEGSIEVDNISLDPRSKQLRTVRQKVGLVFQYPEQQLFAETIFDEVAFAPRNWGVDPDNVAERVENALVRVGLNSVFYHRSPFHLSGGEKRRVAIASVLSADPDYLVLDEPTAGLDASGRKDLMGLLTALREDGLGIVLITHDLELALACSEKILVLQHGRQLTYGTPENVIDSLLKRHVYGLLLPEVVQMSHELFLKGFDVPITGDEFLLAQALIEKVRK